MRRMSASTYQTVGATDQMRVRGDVEALVAVTRSALAAPIANIALNRRGFGGEAFRIINKILRLYRQVNEKSSAGGYSQPYDDEIKAVSCCLLLFRRRAYPA